MRTERGLGSHHPRPPLPAGPWLVVGLVRSGLAAGALLAGRGEHVRGVDSGRPDVSSAAFHCDLETDGVAQLEGIGAVVKSPGVPPRAPVIRAARERGIPVLGELELAWRLMPGPAFVCITGTNGKTTVTEWLSDCLRLGGRRVEMAGNIGRALSTVAAHPLDAEVVVCECSSYQLEDSTDFVPEVGVLLNLGSDHLDWHGSQEAYREAKLRPFARQGPDDVAVLPVGLDVPGGARVERFAPVEAELPGHHNALNGGAMATAARALGTPEEAIRESLRTFAGVEHRLQIVANVDGVVYVDDSKATNVASTLTALEATKPRVHLILGGDDAKGEDFTPLRGRAHATYLIGDAAARLAVEVGGPVVGTLAAAVSAARAAAAPGDTVLLSPACASFDQYRNFEERGRHFRDLVEPRA